MGSSSSAVTLPSGIQTTVKFKSKKKLMDSSLLPELEVIPTEQEETHLFYMKKFFLTQEELIENESNIKKFSTFMSQHISQIFGLTTETSTLYCTAHPFSLSLYGEYFSCNLEKEIEQRQLLPEMSEFKYLSESEGLYIFEVLTATFILLKAQDVNPLFYQTKHIMIEPSGTLKVLNPVFLKHGILSGIFEAAKLPSIYPINHKDRKKQPPKSDASVVWLIGILVLCSLSNTLEEEIYLEDFEISLEKLKESIQVVDAKISETLADILEKCLAVNETERPTLPNLYNIVKQAVEAQSQEDSME